MRFAQIPNIDRSNNSNKTHHGVGISNHVRNKNHHSEKRHPVCPQIVAKNSNSESSKYSQLQIRCPIFHLARARCECYVRRSQYAERY